MRRWIAGAAAGLGLLLAAPVAGADGPQWNKSRITTPTSVTSESFVISAELFRAQNNLTGGSMKVTTSFTTPGGLRPQCGAPGTVPLGTNVQGNPNEQPWVSTAAHSVECNGTYSFEVVATFSRPLAVDDVKRLPGSITVNAPPPEVRSPKAVLEGGTVVLTWSAVSDPPPDFIGYRVERQEPSGKYAKIASLGTSATTFTDTSPPPEGGEVVYRVVALREGPNGEVPSDGGRTNAVNLPVPSTTSVPGATDGGT
ncbi:MAG TPA: hypothetical protein VJ804_14245, partial [Acidimicrobiales bacterium]|nr:hypothetical protein [Acidimicrobiales bacterium]